MIKEKRKIIPTNMAYICHVRDLFKDEINRYLCTISAYGLNYYGIRYNVDNSETVMKCEYNGDRERAMKEFYAPLQKDLQHLPKGFIPVNRNQILEPFKDLVNLNSASVLCYETVDIEALERIKGSKIFVPSQLFSFLQFYYNVVAQQHLIIKDIDGKVAFTTYSFTEKTTHVSTAPLDSVVRMSNMNMSMFARDLFDIL